MADFALWVAGAAKTGKLPFDQEAFEATYFDQQRAATALLFERSPVAMILRDYMKERTNLSKTPSEILDILNARGSDDQKKTREWPKNASWVSRQLKRMAPVMRQHGLDIQFTTEGHAKTRVVQITWVREEGAEDDVERVLSSDI